MAVEEERTVAKDDSTPEVIAALAHQTARIYGCQAVRWWQDTYNPRRLYIELNYTLTDGQPFPVWISTSIPQPLTTDDSPEPQAEQPAHPSIPSVTKMPPKRSDLLTTSPPASVGTLGSGSARRV